MKEGVQELLQQMDPDIYPLYFFKEQTMHLMVSCIAIYMLPYKGREQ